MEDGMKDFVDGVIEKHRGKRTALISILHDIQGQYNHLPQAALNNVALRLEMDLNGIYGVATFYKAFSLVPRGKHRITLCLGTACHVRGGPRIRREIEKQLGIAAGQTTRDRQFSLQAVNCLGVCAIGPVMMVDGKYYGEMNVTKAKRILKKLGKKENGGRA
jgi:NADH:ubiquinone oxidoreductase subunit E